MEIKTSYNSRMVTAALLLATRQSDILKCRHDSNGKVVVAKEQWEYIHQELASKDSARVLKLINPRRNLRVRVVNTSFPEPNGTMTVFRETWSRATVIEKLTQTTPQTFDIRHPGYTYELASHLFPGQSYQSSDSKDGSRTLMKGTMIYEVVTWPSEPKADAKRRRFLRYLNRLSPTTYIRVSCSEGRLWLSEISSDWPAE